MALQRENYVLKDEPKDKINSFSSFIVFIVKMAFNFAVRLVFSLLGFISGVVTHLMVRPISLLYQLFKLLIVYPGITFGLYLVEFLLIPVNTVLMLIFDVSLFGIVNWRDFSRWPDKNYYAYSTVIGGYNNIINNYYPDINNIFNTHRLSSSELYLKQLRYGKTGSRFHMYWNYFNSGYGTSTNISVGSTNQANLGILSVLYLVYKFGIISILFQLLLSFITGMAFVMTKIFINQLTFKIIYNKTCELVIILLGVINDNALLTNETVNKTTPAADYDLIPDETSFNTGLILDPLGFTSSSPKNNVKSMNSHDAKLVDLENSSFTNSVVDEDELLAEKYGNLEYLRKLQSSNNSSLDVASTTGTSYNNTTGQKLTQRQSKSHSSFDKSINKLPKHDIINTSTDMSTLGFNSIPTSVFSTTNRMGSIAGSITEESETSDDEENYATPKS